MKLSPVQGNNKKVFFESYKQMVFSTVYRRIADAGSTNRGSHCSKVAYRSCNCLVYAEAGYTVEPITTIED